MTYLLAILGALWRRWLGAENSGSRVWKFLALFLQVALAYHDAPLLILPVFGVLSAWFTIRTDNGGVGWYWLLRYGPFGAGYALKQFNVRTPLLGATEWAELFLGGSTMYAVEALKPYLVSSFDCLLASLYT